MSPKLKEILEKRQQNGLEITPLWRLALTSKDFIDINAYVIEQINRYDPSDSSIVTVSSLANIVGADLCVLFAYWWQNIYEGGDNSYKRILSNLGIAESRQNQIINILYYELKGKNNLGIYVSKSESNRNLFKTSLFAQGGFPHKLTELLGDNNFIDFMVKLINYYNQSEGNIDMQYIKSLQSETFNSTAFKNNKSVTESCLTILDVYCDYKEGGTIPDEYGEIFQNIQNRLSNTSTKDLTYFKVEWALKFNEGNLSIEYRPICPKSILYNLVASNSISLQFAINNNPIANYVQEISNDKKTPFNLISSNSSWITLKQDEQNLRLQYFNKSDIYDYKLSKSSIPFGELPVILVDDGKRWIQKKGTAIDQYVCIMPTEWNCSNKFNLETAKLFGKDFNYFYFDWNHIDGSSLSFINPITNQTLSYGINDDIYDISFCPPILPTIISASIPLCIGITNFREFVTIHNNKEGFLIYHMRGIEFFYRMFNEQNFVKYDDGNLPDGIIVFMVKYRNAIETFRFFNMNEIEIKQKDDHSYSYVISHGSIISINNQPVTVENGIICVNDKKFMDNLKFRLFSNTSTNSIDFSLYNPCERSCFVDAEGNIISNKVISTKDLSKYWMHLSQGKNIISLELIENSGSYDLTCLRKKRIVSKITSSLNYYSDDIERFFTLFHAIKSGRRIRLSLQNSSHLQSSTLIVKNYKINLSQEGEGITTRVYAQCGSEYLENCDLVGICTDIKSSDQMFGVIKKLTFERDEEGVGCYTLNEFPRDYRHIIVFSRDRNNQACPLYINKNDNDNYDNRLKKKDDNISKTLDLLENCDVEAWSVLWWHFHLILEYGLHFTALNCMNAIAQSFKAQAYFITHLCDSPYICKKLNDGKDHIRGMVRDLERMEKELGIAFHIIPSTLIRQFLPNDEAEKRAQYLQGLLANQFNDEDLASQYLINLFDSEIKFENLTGDSTLTDDDLIEFDMVRFNSHYEKNPSVMMHNLSKSIPISAAKIHRCDDEDISISEKDCRLVNYFRYNCTSTYNYNLLTSLNSNNKKI